MRAVRDHAFLPGPACVWVGEWTSLPAAPITAVDVAPGPYFVGILV